MKNKGVLISMAAILVIGILITKSTHQFIENNSSGAGASPRLEAETAGDILPAAGMPETGAQGEGNTVITDAPVRGAGQAREETTAGQVQGELEEEAGAEEEAAPVLAGSMARSGSESKTAYDQGAAVQEELPLTDMGPEPQMVGEGGPGGDWEPSMAAITPLDTTAAGEDQEPVDGERMREKNVAAEENQSYYRKRLQDLDNQILKNRDTQDTSNINSSARSSAANELKLWDGELNSIYGEILDCLNQEETQELVKAQREWMKERDSLAMDAVKNSSGGSRESIEYTVSLTESTRQRAYELVDLYEDRLAK